ncbi:MAG TPA: MlaD family protein [Fimbriimonas sp.]|nr:MlaD family protein [Fimbriimonas sp.]
MKSAAKVGLLLVVFIALVIGSYQILGHSLIAKRNRTIFVDMPDAGGMAPGTSVLMAGVRIGSVEKVTLIDPHNAQLTLRIEEKYGVPPGSTAVVSGSLVGLGDTPLMIEAPIGATGALADGAHIRGSKSGPLDNVLPGGGKDLYNNINGTLTSVQHLLKDEQLPAELKKLLKTANVTLVASQTSLKRFNDLAGQASGLIEKNQGNLTAMVSTMRGTIQQVHDTAGAVARFVKEGKLQNGTVALLDRASKIETQASDLLTKLNSIAGDEQLKANLKATAQNISDTTAQGPALAANAKKITANIADITESAKPLPDKLNEVATKASDLETRLSHLLDKVESVKPPSAAGLRNLSTELDLFRETTPGYWRTDINGTLPTHDGFVTFGIYDAFESNKLNIQIGKSLSPKFDFRYGVYASKPAVGVDYDFTPKFGLRTDVWNINSPEFDARFRYDFGGGLYGWLGVDRIFSGTAPTLGFGIRK